MLGTFSFEPYFKSYCWFTDWSLEFLEIADRSTLLPPHASLSASLFQRRRRVAAPPTAQAGPRPPPARHGIHASRPDSTPPSFPRAGTSSPCHATPEAPAGYHLAAAVDGPLQHLGSPTRARHSTWRSPASFSPPCLTRSLPQTHRTPLPPPWPPSPSELTVEPPPPPFPALNRPHQ